MADQEPMFDECVVRLYDAATDLDRWPAFRDALSRCFGAQVSQVLHYSFEDERLTFRAYRGYEHLPPALVQRYDELSPEDATVQYTIRHPGKATTPAMVMDEATFLSTPLHRECFAPSGLGGYGRMISVFIEPASFVGVGRQATDPPFVDADRDLFGRLVPHFKQALALHHRLAQIETATDNALAALDAMPTGIILTDRYGQIRQTNRTAEEILLRGDGLLRRDGFILTRHPRDTARLLYLVRKAVLGAAGNEAVAGESLPIARSHGEPYPVLVSALWRNQQKLGFKYLPAPLAVLYVTDLDRPMETPADLLQRLFGLTNAEAVLAARMVAGATLNAVAAEQGLSRNTVRTHLQSVFEKTGTRRQSELIRKLLQTPVWIAAREAAEAWRKTAPGAADPA